MPAWLPLRPSSWRPTSGSTHHPAFVAKTVAFAFGLAASSFFPTLIMGIFSKKINKEGAIAGMIAGIGFTLAYIVYFQFLTDSKEYWFGISPEGIGFIGMLINFAVAFVVSSLTPRPLEKSRTWSRQSAYPRAPARPRTTDAMKAPRPLPFSFLPSASAEPRKGGWFRFSFRWKDPLRMGREEGVLSRRKGGHRCGFSRQKGSQQRISRQQDGIRRL